MSLQRFLDEFPDAPWNMDELSSNPNVTWDLVKKYPNMKWDFVSLSCNENITTDIIIENPQFSWNVEAHSINPNVTQEILKKYPQLSWDYHNLSMNSSITYDYIFNNPQLPWPDNIAMNSSYRFTDADILKYNIPFNVSMMHNPKINIDYLLSSGTLNNYSLSAFAERPDVTYKMFKKIHKHVDSTFYEKNPNFKIKHIRKITRSEVWNWISHRSDIPEDVVERYIYKDWDWKYLIRSPMLSIDFVMRNKNRFEKRELKNLCLNPNLRIHHIKKYPEIKLNFNHLSRNLFGKDPILIQRKKICAEKITHKIFENIRNEDCPLNKIPTELLQYILSMS